VTVHNCDITIPGFQADPFSVFAKLRAMGPILKTRLPMLGECWITTTYESADKVLRDQKHFCTDAINAGHKSRTAMLGKLNWFLPRTMKAMVQNMLTMDEPDHRRLRNLVESAFVRQSVDELRPKIATIVDAHLDYMEEIAEVTEEVEDVIFVDFQEEFARRVPLAVICELLGLPREDHDQFAKWCDFGAAKGLVSMVWAMRHMGKLERYLKKQFEECRREPRPGMISALVQAEHEGHKLSEDELLASVLVLLIAGHETTTHLITVGLVALDQHPEARAELMADWSKVSAAVDEMLRYNSTIQMTKPRYARQDVELYGQRIKRGEFVMPLLAAGNYDPAEFPDPDVFDINRPNNHHMAFGRGIHVCLGLKLAKAEAEIAFERLLTRYPKLQVATPYEKLKWSGRIGMRSLKELPVVLAPAKVQQVSEAARRAVGVKPKSNTCSRFSPWR